MTGTRLPSPIKTALSTESQPAEDAALWDRTVADGLERDAAG